jgi:hypothetical protein
MEKKRVGLRRGPLAVLLIIFPAALSYGKFLSFFLEFF